MSNRIEKINNLIKEELGKILLKEVDFEKDVLVTITRVNTSPDLLHSTIYLTVFKNEKEKETLKILENDVYNIQQSLNKKLQMRPIPKIRFEIDKLERHAERIEEVLGEIGE